MNIQIWEFDPHEYIAYARFARLNFGNPNNQTTKQPKMRQTTLPTCQGVNRSWFGGSLALRARAMAECAGANNSCTLEARSWVGNICYVISKFTSSHVAQGRYLPTRAYAMRYTTLRSPFDMLARLYVVGPMSNIPMGGALSRWQGKNGTVSSPTIHWHSAVNRIEGAADSGSGAAS